MTPCFLSTDRRYLYAVWAVADGERCRRHSRLVNLVSGDEVRDVFVYAYDAPYFCTADGLFSFESQWQQERSIRYPQFFDALGRCVSVSRLATALTFDVAFDGQTEAAVPASAVAFVTGQGISTTRPKAVQIDAAADAPSLPVHEAEADRFWSAFGPSFLALADSYLTVLEHLPAIMTREQLTGALRLATERRRAMLFFPNIRPVDGLTTIDLMRPLAPWPLTRLSIDIDEPVPTALQKRLHVAFESEQLQLIESASGNLHVVADLVERPILNELEFVTTSLAVIERLVSLGLRHIDFVSMQPKVGLFCPEVGVFRKGGRASRIL